MPTSYTSKICEQDQSFSEFVLGCARAFGACISQRDDPMDDLPKLPEKTHQSRYENELIKYESALADLLGMSKKDRISLGMKKQKKEIAYFKKAIKERKIVRARLDKMHEQVRSWVPPSKDHEGLKTFMLEQLESTMRYDGDVEYYETRLMGGERKTPLDYYDEEVESAKWSVGHAKEDLKKAKARTIDKSKWITELYESLQSDPSLSHLLLKKGMK